MVNVPVRSDWPVFLDTLNRTVLLPVPLLPAVTTIHEALLTVCHEHADPSAYTLTLTLPPECLALSDWMDRVVLQPGAEGSSGESGVGGGRLPS